MDDVVYYCEVSKNQYTLIGGEFALGVYLATGGDASCAFYDTAGFPYDVRRYIDGREELI